MLLFVSVGSAYLLTSVGVSIYRRRRAEPTGAQVSAAMTAAETKGCYDDLEDITQGLYKHLENFHHLLAGYDPAEAQRWADEGSVWRRQWAVLGKRCQFGQIRGKTLRKELEEMAAIHDELGKTQQIYTNELLRFGKDQAPRLDRIRKRIEKIGGRIARSSGSPAGENEND